LPRKNGSPADDATKWLKAIMTKALAKGNQRFAASALQ